MAAEATDDRHQCHTDPDDVAAARDWLRSTMTHHGIAADVQRDLTLAFTEITTKVLPRAEGRPSEDKVEIQLSVTPTAVHLSVVDASPPFKPGPEADEDGEGGMGLLMLHVLVDDVSVGPGPSGGSVTTVTKNRQVL